MTRRTIPALAAAVVSVVVVSACSSSGSGAMPPAGHGSSSPPAIATASVRLGALRITGGYVPEPASPDVAAAYFTVQNTGATSDRLTRVTTNVTRHVLPMTETVHGSAGSMTRLPNVVVPAHGTFRFTPGHAHLMLEQPRRTLMTGDHVTMTVTFAHAGTATLRLPVVPLTGVGPGTGMSPMPMPGMTMSGSG